jgi:hypothetical protein
MSAAPQSGGPEHPGRMSGKRLRLVILLVAALVVVVVIGYLLLVGGTVGDSGHG